MSEAVAVIWPNEVMRRKYFVETVFLDKHGETVGSVKKARLVTYHVMDHLENFYGRFNRLGDALQYCEEINMMYYKEQFKLREGRNDRVS